MSGKVEFSNAVYRGDALESGNRSGSQPRKGCFLTVVELVVLALVAVCISVIVGLVVYYTRPDGDGSADGSHDGMTGTSTSTAPPEATSIFPPTTTMIQPPESIRLPDYLTPSHYDVTIRPDIYSGEPKEFKFNGSVTIFFNSTVSTNSKRREIYLHHRELQIDAVSIEVQRQELGVWKDVQVDRAGIRILEEPWEFYIIPLEENLLSSKYRISMSFKGNISSDLKGIYYSSYQGDHETRYLLTSQLQPTDARKVFPCFDEPSLKATFRVGIERKEPLKSHSCTEIINSRNLADDWVRDEYQTTLRMSTYLLAFLVSDFSCTENKTNEDKLVEICARPTAFEQTEFAASIAVPMQEWFEDYHNISYPFNKTTHVAVPDFAAGAMENWGLIIYRETALLYSNETSSIQNKQRVAVVVAHELAHMWFGNLVTPGWWDDIWLNEGFASFMELKAIDNTRGFQKWNMDAQFLARDLQDVMRLDSLETSHPIYQDINNPADIGEIFDTITYSKGASVIRMMEKFLGEAIFKEGLSEYLKANAYDLVTYRELFEFLSEKTSEYDKPLNVTNIMETWILQMGYPVVSVTKMSDTKFQIRQKHFLLDSTVEVTRPSPFNYLWQVPLTYTSSDTATSGRNITWLTDEQMDLNLTTPVKESEWILMNIDQDFYYRVNYDLDNWNKLVVVLMTNHTIFAMETRSQLIDDSFQLGRAGLLDQLVAFNITKYMALEKEFTPWYTLGENLGHIRRILEDSSSIGHLRTFVQNQVKSLHEELGWRTSQDDDHLSKSLGQFVISFACIYRLPECRNKSKSFFRDWQNGTTLHPDMARIVFCNGIAEGGESEWDYAYDMMNMTNSAAEKSALLYSLGCTQKSYLLAKYLQRALEENQHGISRQDMVQVIDGVASNTLGKHMAWYFFKSNWNIIYERFGSLTFSLTNMIEILTRGFSTEWELRDLETFIENTPNQGTGETAFKQAVSNVKANIKWRRDNEERVSQWLLENI